MPDAVPTPAAAALERAGVSFVLHRYEHSATHAFGEEAAAALDVEPERVFKTLVCVVDGRLAIAVVPVTTTLQMKAMAKALSAKHAELADATRAERASGYVTGGISPFGQRQRLPVVVDESTMDFVSIFVSGGRRGLEIEIAPQDLISVTDATVAPLANA